MTFSRQRKDDPTPLTLFRETILCHCIGVFLRRSGFVFLIKDQEHCVTEDGQALAQDLTAPSLSLTLALNSHREKFAQRLLVWLFGRQ